MLRPGQAFGIPYGSESSEQFCIVDIVENGYLLTVQDMNITRQNAKMISEAKSTFKIIDHAEIKNPVRKFVCVDFEDLIKKIKEFSPEKLETNIKPLN